MPENINRTGPFIGAIDEGTSSARFLVSKLHLCLNSNNENN